MTREEKCAYHKGYTAGSRRRWPAHRPPTPPVPALNRLMAALMLLRNEADGLCATLDAADTFCVVLGPAIDETDAAMEEITRWLLEEGTP